MKFAYYPGCAAEETAKEADRSMRAVAKNLGITLVDFPNMTCCGAGALREERPNLSVAINARILAIAEKAELDLITICNTCTLNLLKSKHDLDTNDELKERVNEKLKEFDLEYTGTTKITHLLWVLIDEFGLDKLEKHIKRKLTGIKIAPFYGCHILRPQELFEFEDARNPDSLEKVIRLVGAEPAMYDERTDCCGFHIMLVERKATTGMVKDCLESAKDSGADLLVTPCTLCQIVLDTYQHDANKEAGRTMNLPIIHLQQLIGLALGMDAKSLGFKKHIVKIPRGIA